MPAIVYPSDLPCPQGAPIQLTERRLLSSDGGLYQARTVQRDRHAIQQITFPPFSPAQAATFRTWWEDTLVLGGNWFAATWPMPAGYSSVVRRFLAPPKWEHLAGGFWRVSAECEVRGVGLPPDGNRPDGNRDAYWDSVVLLARLNGLNNGTVFTDLTGRHTLTAASNAKTTTGLSLFGETTALALASGTADFVSVTGNIGDFDFTGVPVTFEMFGAIDATVTGLMGTGYTPQPSGYGWEWTLQSLTTISFLQHLSAGLRGFQATLSPGAVNGSFSHVAFTFNGSSAGWFHCDGVYQAASVVGVGVPSWSTDGNVRIGSASNGPYYTNGRLLEVRVTRGVARYPQSNIVVPSEHFATHH